MGHHNNIYIKKPHQSCKAYNCVRQTRVSTTNDSSVTLESNKIKRTNQVQI